MNDGTTAEHDVTNFLRLIWAARFYVITCMLLVLPIGIILMHVLSPLYQAEAIIAPPEDEQTTGSLSHVGIAGLNLSSLASDLSSQGSASFESFLQVITSHQLAEDLQQKYSVLQTLYPQKWDVRGKSWKPSGPLGGFKSFIKFLITGQPKRPPDSYILDQLLSEKLSFSQIQPTSFYTITLVDNDRAESERLLGQILSVADSNVRNTHMARARQQIKYLETKLREVTLEQHREALTNLLINEERTLMLAQSSAPFSFQLISPISAPPDPISPRWLTILGICELLGAAVGMLGYHFRDRIGMEAAISSARESFEK